MLGEHIVIRGVEHRVAGREDDVLLPRAAQEARVGAQCVDIAGIFAHVFAREERGQDAQAVVAGVQIPLLAAAQVIHQRVVVLLHDHADVAHAGIDHIG